MAYNPNIPQPGDKIKDSQAQILANFQALAPLIDGEIPTDFLILPEQGAAPSTGANQMGVYTKQGSFSSASELFVRRESDGAELNVTQSSLGSNGWSFLPSGLLIKWGSANVTGSGAGHTATITFPAGGTIPAFGTIYNVQVSARSTAPANIQVLLNGAPGTASFSVQVSNSTGSANATATVYYFAIGIV